MKEKIKENISDAGVLERLYREDKKSFESGFEKIYPEIAGSETAKFWKTRLDYEKSTSITNLIFGPDIFIMLAVCLVAGILIKIPIIFDINTKNFLYYEKNSGIIVFLAMVVYSIIINKDFKKRNLVITMLIFAVSAVYINLLPDYISCASINLVFIHMPLLMWCLYGLVYIGFDLKNLKRRIDFIRHNGDLAVMGALLVIAGGILAAITLGLFQAIGLHIEKFYMNYVVIIGAISAPVLTAFVLKKYPAITNKIAPLIANIFSPLVLITLIVFLIAIPLSGKDPFNDRDFLLIFNMMLIGVMAIIVFSVSETSMNVKQKFNEIILFALSIVTLVVNLIALLAIFYRLGEFGLTPNRIAVLGANILVFVNLILITIDLFRINFRKSELERVELTISKYLPVYIVWVLIVVFLFPVVFGMK